jgi:Flp pilus assembly protein TadD
VPSKTRPILSAVVSALFAVGVFGCAGTTGVVRQAQQDLNAGRVDEAVVALESAAEASPGSFEVLHELGIAYYLRARKALDEERYEDYGDDLERALDQWIKCLRIDPASPTPHTWMGIVAAYQGSLDSAEKDFRNAMRLAPQSWVSHTNLAQTLIYKGQLSQARHYLSKGERLRASPVVIELNLALAAWRAGDLVEARDMFDSAYRTNPEEVNIWDVAPVPEPIESFRDFTTYCCASPACGPYMEVACKQMQLEVKRRQVRDETVLREIRIEMERRRQLEEIYRRRRDLKIEVEPVEETP